MIGAVVLTQGLRPVELAAALGSLTAQQGVETEIVVVGNGWTPTVLPEGVRAIALPEDRGIPAGRNAGVGTVGGELLFFLDDDARLAEPDALAAVAARFAADPSLGLLQLRVDAADGGRPPRDWVPRLRVGDRTRSSDVTAVWEGAVAIRRSVFEAVGGWPEPFVRGHEGVDLAWRVLDAGHRVAYAGDIAVLHPAYVTAPHDRSVYYGARNRVWLARRNLPLPLGVLYVAGFMLRTLPVLRSRPRARAALRGYRDGLRLDCGPRRRLRARTLWLMTRNGRPPVI
ncbi:MAG TPA: glycosyltransferase [Solirubrobacteraceae bacterium]|nr:glycosyltransferase [Solirubrobacteraceae bacterium]